VPTSLGAKYRSVKKKIFFQSWVVAAPYFVLQRPGLRSEQSAYHENYFPYAVMHCGASHCWLLPTIFTHKTALLPKALLCLLQDPCPFTVMHKIRTALQPGC